MKALYATTLAFFFGISCLHAQRIHFTDTSNRWVVHWSHYDEGTGFTYASDSYIKLRDTVVGGEQSFIYCYSEDGVSFTSSNELILSEDTVLKKVYAKNTSAEDTVAFVLYDFMMEEGDVLSIYSPSSFAGSSVYEHTCTAVYPDILIDGVPHRAFEVFDGCGSYTVIEGLGSLLHPNYPIIGCGERTTINVICFENNGARPAFLPLFGNNCYLSVDDQDPLKPGFGLSPNPASEQLNISMSQAGSVFQCSVHDILGRQVYQAELKDKVTLNISAWQAGTYLVRIIDNKGNSAVKRFLKL